MSMRVLAIAGLSVVALAVAVEVWWELGSSGAPPDPVRMSAPSAAVPATLPPTAPPAQPALPPPAETGAIPIPTLSAPGLPLPPMPPRIATGAEYERCLTMLTTDPVGANALAEAWEATGGGDGARHCHAAAQISLGRMAVGAEMLEKLARATNAPALARAFIYGQATQAWLLAGDAQRAYASATLALAMSPDDVDLMIDRSIAAATMDRYLDAIEDLNLALDRDPKRTDALVFRAAAWRHDGQLGLAQDDIDRALKLDPDYPEALLERGILHQRRGNPIAARADWQRVLDLATDSAAADLAQQNLNLLEAGPARRP